MELVRLAVVSLVAWSIAGVLTYTVWKGLRCGKMGHSDSSSYIERAGNPVAYWALALLFSVMAGACVLAWLRVFADSFFR